jgi:hypothetical protein
MNTQKVLCLGLVSAIGHAQVFEQSRIHASRTLSFDLRLLPLQLLPERDKPPLDQARHGLLGVFHHRCDFGQTPFLQQTQVQHLALSFRHAGDGSDGLSIILPGRNNLAQPHSPSRGALGVLFQTRRLRICTPLCLAVTLGLDDGRSQNADEPRPQLWHRFPFEITDETNGQNTGLLNHIRRSPSSRL